MLSYKWVIEFSKFSPNFSEPVEWIDFTVVKQWMSQQLLLCWCLCCIRLFWRRVVYLTSAARSCFPPAPLYSTESLKLRFPLPAELFLSPPCWNLLCKIVTSSILQTPRQVRLFPAQKPNLRWILFPANVQTVTNDQFPSVCVANVKQFTYWEWDIMPGCNSAASALSGPLFKPLM